MQESFFIFGSLNILYYWTWWGQLSNYFHRKKEFDFEMVCCFSAITRRSAVPLLRIATLKKHVSLCWKQCWVMLREKTRGVVPRTAFTLEFHRLQKMNVLDKITNACKAFLFGLFSLWELESSNNKWHHSSWDTYMVIRVACFAQVWHKWADSKKTKVKIPVGPDCLLEECAQSLYWLAANHQLFPPLSAKKLIRPFQ